jgi:putative ABC transport system permease protein
MADRARSRSRLGELADQTLELARDALREVRAHKLRSFLTLSGVVFGAASVVAMTSLAAGVKNMAYEELERMGMPRSFVLFNGSPRSDARRAAELREKGLRVADLEALRRLPGVQSAHARSRTEDLVVTTPLAQRSLRVDGVDAGYFELRNWPIRAGRTLVPLDVENHARVAVLGSLLAEDFFGNANPIGRPITIDGVRFTVVGLVDPVPLNFIPADLTWSARRIYVPYTWMTRYRLGEGRVSDAYVTATTDADFAEVLHAGEALVRQRHGVTDFTVSNEAAEVAENMAMADDILGGWNAVIFAIAGITLVVGGIGLFSVLLISVRERVREIGIRKALGADEGDIQRLFMAESLTLAVTGAVVGILGGVGLIAITRLIAQSFGRVFTIPVYVPGVLASVVFAALVGLVFGWYPARRAARLNPIEAISEI